MTIGSELQAALVEDIAATLTRLMAPGDRPVMDAARAHAKIIVRDLDRRGYGFMHIEGITNADRSRPEKVLP
jgi:hypothetical protein